MAIFGNMVGGAAPLKTLKLVDSNGSELLGVVVDQETIFTAGDNDVREGMVYASDEGVSTGTKNIPSYHTCTGVKVIPVGSELKISNLDTTTGYYDYTQLQAIVCSFNTSISNSVSAEKVSIGDNVYNVNSTDTLSAIIKNHDDKSINFGITNDAESPCIIRFFTYKEIL